MCWETYFRLPGHGIDTLTLKMTFNHQNRSRYYSSKLHSKDVLHFLCLLKIVFLISELTFDDLELKLPLKITLNHTSKTIIGFVSQNPQKEGITHAVFVKKDIFSYLTLKLTSWPWRWPWIIRIISDIECPVKIAWKKMYYTCSKLVQNSNSA